MESRSFGSIPADSIGSGNYLDRNAPGKRSFGYRKAFSRTWTRAELDPHHFAPVIADEKGDDFHLHLIPFRSAIRAGVNCVMTSHAVYRAVDDLHPATLSHEISHRWLRERLGFEGVLFGDDLDMAAISENYSPEEIAFLGLSCSTDFFLLCQKSESIEPMHRALADQLDRNQSLQRFHRATIRRLERLRLFHFA